MPEAFATLPVLLASACLLAAVAAAWHLWYGWGVSRILAAQGVPTWRAWVPLLREAELFRLGNVDPVRAALLLVPFVAVYGVVLQVIAMRRIGAGYGRGAGMTVLGAVLPPAWATVLAGAQPPAEPERATADDDEPALLLVAGADAAASGVSAPPAAPIAAPPVMDLPEAGVADPRPLPIPASAPISHVPGVSAPAPAAETAAPASAALAPAAPAPEAPPTPVTAPPAPPASAPRTAVPAEIDDRTHLVSGVREWELVLPDGTAVVLVSEAVVLGRRPAPTDPSVQAVAVPDRTRTVSKQHARLEWSGDAWTITDLGSTNGVSLLPAGGPEQLIAPGAPVPVGDAFLLGECRVEVRRSVA